MPSNARTSPHIVGRFPPASSSAQGVITDQSPQPVTRPTASSRCVFGDSRRPDCLAFASRRFGHIPIQHDLLATLSLVMRRRRSSTLAVTWYRPLESRIRQPSSWCPRRCPLGVRAAPALNEAGQSRHLDTRISPENLRKVATKSTLETRTRKHRDGGCDRATGIARPLQGQVTRARDGCATKQRQAK